MSIPPDGYGSEYDREGSQGGEGGPGFGPYNPTDLPGRFLSIIGILSLLWACFQLFRGYQAKDTPVAEFDQQLEEMKKILPPEWFADPKFTGQFLKDQTIWGAFVGGGIGFVVAPIIILGGLRMRLQQSYALAVSASVLSCIPCLTCTGCCGLGQGIGIWALVVLMKPDVRALFR